MERRLFSPRTGDPAFIAALLGLLALNAILSPRAFARDANPDPLNAQISPPYSWEYARNFVDELRYDTLEQMRGAQLEASQLDTQPWSDSYWPIYEGGIAYRYADENFPFKGNWATNARYIFNTLGKRPVAMLSPAEKYDLLVGDENFTLASAMANTGAKYSNNGDVEEWMGYCHGWAQAALMLPRPRETVTVTAADGVTQIPFRPSDIKALATLLWANGTFRQRFIGGRCEKSRPPHENDRPTEPVCLDLNPGTWHLSIVNQIGVSRRGFVMDADRKYEVWNQPVLGYSYRYWNPMTEQFVDSLEAAKVSRQEFSSDPYSRYRSSQATYIVGIEMRVNYIFETLPSLEDQDSESEDKVKTLTLRYDLEISRAGKIVGGEWHKRNYPDFIWITTPGTRAVSNGDSEIPGSSKWNGRDALPGHWARTAHWTSSYSQPLAKIVETLISLASQ